MSVLQRASRTFLTSFAAMSKAVKDDLGAAAFELGRRAKLAQELDETLPEPLVAHVPSMPIAGGDIAPLGASPEVAEARLTRARCRVAVLSGWSAEPVQSRVLGATSRTITQLPRPFGRS